MSLIDDILKQRRELEKQPPTLEEIADDIAKKYLSKISLKNTPKHLKKCEETAELLKQIIAKTDTSAPYKDEDFISHIPDMHLSWIAMEKIDKNIHMGEIYALVMTKIYKGNIPFEVEKIILALDGETLLQQITKSGHTWSSRAKTIMQRFHPKVYKLLFEVHYQPTGYTL